MSTLKAPSVSIAFALAASSAMQRSDKGTVALILRDAALADKTYSLASAKQIPAELGAVNQAAVQRAFWGYVNPPKRVLLYMVDRFVCNDGSLYARCPSGLPSVTFQVAVVISR